MSLRVSLLGIVWFLALILLFITPLYEEPELLFSFLPLRSIVHLFMFWGFSHVWIVALKRQFKFGAFRRKAFLIILMSSFLIAIIAETSVYIIGQYPTVNYWNLTMDFLGAILGGISFRLLYSSCY